MHATPIITGNLACQVPRHQVTVDRAVVEEYLTPAERVTALFTFSNSPRHTSFRYRRSARTVYVLVCICLYISVFPSLTQRHLPTNLSYA